MVGAGQAGHRQQAKEGDDADAVVEERLARDLRLEAGRRVQLLQQAHHRDRIGRRDQRAEDQADLQTQVHADRPEDQPRQHADDRYRQQQADRGQQADRPAVVDEAVEVDVQRAGEEQEAQQALQQGAVEVDLAQEPLDHRPHADLRCDFRDQEDRQRADERDEQRAARRRQAQHPMVDVAGRGGHHHQHRGDVEDVHREGSLDACDRQG